MNDTVDQQVEAAKSKDPSDVSISTTTKPKIPQKLQVALAVFTLAGGLAAGILPHLARLMGDSGQPTLLQISLTGIALIIVTSILLKYSAQVIGLSSSWMLMAIAYNSLIILMKFILSPISLYSQTFTLDFFSFDPNSRSIYFFVAGCIGLVYVSVFALIYRRRKKRLENIISSEDPMVAKKPLNKKAVTILVVLGVLAAISGGGLLLAPLFALSPSVSYMNYVFSGAMGFALLVALVFTILTASMTFQRAEETALKMRDGTILATFFWLGLSMILIYHAMWVVFMSIMVSIWPLKTISPSGK